MKACFFLPSLAGGGAERVFVSLANHFAAQGRDITLVCATVAGPLRKEVSSLVKTVDLGVDRSLLAIFPLRRLLRRDQPDVMFSCMTHANVTALAAAMLADYKGRVLVQDVALLSRGRDNEGLRGSFIKLLMPFLYSRATHILAVSDSIAVEVDAATRGRARKTEVLANPVDLDRVRSLAAAPLDHPWIGHGGGLILAVGRLSAEKNFSGLLRSLAIMRRARDVRLILAGAGELRGALQQEVQALGLREHVDFIGYTDNPYAWMAKVDATVVSSTAEGFSLILVEAMACGCPVVSTACGSGPAKLLQDGGLGPLVPPADDQALADAVLRRLALPRDEMSLREGVSIYDLPAIADRYGTLIFGAQA